MSIERAPLESTPAPLPLPEPESPSSKAEAPRPDAAMTCVTLALWSPLVVMGILGVLALVLIVLDHT